MTMDPTFIKERAGTSFDVQKMIDWRNGGAYNTELINIVDTMIQRDKSLMKERFFDLTTKENRRKTMQQIRRYTEIKKTLPPHMKKILNGRMELYDGSASMRIYVHETLFNETIQTQGSDEQYQKYKDDILNWRIIGCFAMTELGNSSYLRGLETVAVYDKENRQFNLTSPTTTATKWWIGMSGQTATHTVALANLVVDGVKQGLNWFVVPLRDRNTGELLPGVSAGHLGEKMGRPGLDNGWIQFTNVILPYDAMLNRWSYLSPEGEYTPPPNPAIAYATLIGERILAVASASYYLAPVLTVTTRYSLIRRQGPQQQQIMDFQSHQLLILPIIANVYMIDSCWRKLFADWQKLLTPESFSDGSFLMEAQDYHGISAGLKAWYGWYGADALETVRRTMGGHGYSAYSNIANTISSYGVVTTGGGDNIVLAQQCAKFLLNAYKQIKHGNSVGWTVKYLEYSFSDSKLNVRTGSDLKNINVLKDSFKWLSNASLGHASSLLEKSMINGMNKSEAWNENMMECIQASRPHCVYFLLNSFQEIIATAPSELRVILEKLCLLAGLQSMQDMSDMFLEYGYINRNTLLLIRNEKKKLCQDMRTDVLGLVDGFHLPDYIIKSPLGTYSGVDMYENYLKTIQSGPDQGKAEYWDDEVAPLVRPNL